MANEIKQKKTNKLQQEEIGYKKTLTEKSIDENFDNSLIKNSRRFNKTRCIKNLRFLIKRKKIKMRTIEERANVSPGYLARLEKEGNITNPSIEFLAEASDILETSIDDLINYDLEELNPNDCYVKDFINKLIKDTKESKLYWIKESVGELTKSAGRKEENVKHPLFKPEWREESFNDYYVYPKYHSQFFPDKNWYVWNCFYKANITGGSIYITSIHDYENVSFSNELYLINSNGVTTKLSFYNSDYNSFLGHITKILYEVADESSNHARLSVDVMDVIDAYMGDECKKKKIQDEEMNLIIGNKETNKDDNSEANIPDELPFY